MRAHVPSLLLIGISASMLAVLVACGASPGAASNGPAQAAESSSDTASVGVAETCSGGYILSTQARDHIGEEGTVCGHVADYRFITGQTGKPTLLLFDEGAVVERGSSVSDQEIPATFRAVIWKEDANKNFPANFAVNYQGTTVCVTGLIETHEDSPAIIAKTPDQLKIGC